MPTPRPIITATMVAISGTATTPESNPMVPMPTRSATSATTIGRLMATSDPKAIASTTTATRMPIFSLPGSASPAARPRPASYST
jgi:hypothetical protein